jgi:Domain of unknown function (DUF6602)
MPNQILVTRLEGIRQALIAGYASAGGMSAATKGREREVFIDNFLSRVLPATFRFGTGDATDAHGNRSGQLDVVVEYPLLPSLPAVGGQPRLYLAEGVAAVIEVKSDLAGQWGEILQTVKALHTLQRTFAASLTFGGPRPSNTIPLFAVGYRGWSKLETLQQHLAGSGVDGALVIESALFAAQPSQRVTLATGPAALWGLIVDLDWVIRGLVSAAPDPVAYLQ